MNAIKKMMVNENVDKNTVSKTNLTLVSKEDKKATVEMSKEYLNEKLYYFYTNGGPIMDL